MKNAVEVKHLVKKYKGGFQLGEIDLEIPTGSIVGLIGENGAGKTTLIKSMLGIINVSSGDVTIFEKDCKKYEKEIKEDVGVVLDNMFFSEVLNAADINAIMGGIYKNWDDGLFFKYVADFELPKKSSIKTLSKGMRKKLEIAAALAHHPKLLVLDEPTSGLDPVVRGEILDLFLEFIQDEGRAILLSTHITSDLEHVADKIVFIDDGKKILDETRDGIMNNYAVLRCKIGDFDEISKEDVVSCRKTRYECEILVNDKSKIKGKYNGFAVDDITLEKLMILVVKGEKQ